jgi:putative Mg2+ transporter-C (MgtC) family protein
VIGLTTAATLWMVTVIGLAFGSGEIALGVVATALALLIVWGLKHAETYLPREQRAALVVAVAADGPSRQQLCAHIAAAGLHIAGEAVTYSDEARLAETHFEVTRRGSRRDVQPPAFLEELGRQAGVRKLQWMPQGVPS